MRNDRVAARKVSLDADTAGSILVFLAEFRTYVMEALRQGVSYTAEGAADQCYMIGNVEGRCLYDGLTLDDLEMLEDWEEELDDWKEAHNGQIIVIQSTEPTDEEIEEVLAIDEELEEFCREHDPDWDND